MNELNMPQKTIIKDSAVLTNSQNLSATKKTPMRKTKLLVIGGLLSAIGILIPLIMPKIIIVPGVMSVTPASHIAVMIAMFINPWIAIAVTLTTTLGFFITTTPIIALRALSHIGFAVIGSLLAKKMLEKKWTVVALNFIVAIIHALFEMLVVYMCMFIFANQFTSLTVSLAYYLCVLVGLITIAHSTFDFILAYSVYLPLKKFKLI